MGAQRFTPEVKEEAVRQITERGYSVADVSERLGVSAHSLYKWLRSVKPDNSVHQAQDLLDARTEILRLKARLKRTFGKPVKSWAKQRQLLSFQNALRTRWRVGATGNQS